MLFLRYKDIEYFCLAGHVVSEKDIRISYLSLNDHVQRTNATSFSNLIY